MFKKSLNEIDSINSTQQPKKDSYEGVNVEVGAVFAVQKASTDSKEFKDSPTSVSASAYGGSFTLGYSKRVAKRLYVGIALGVDGTRQKNRMWSGGAFSKISDITQQKIFKTKLLGNLLRTVSQRISDSVAMSNVDFAQVRNYFHYLGGSSNDYPSFPINLTLGCADDVFSQIRSYGASISNSADPFLHGLNSLREFASEQFPAVSRVLAEVASTNSISTWNGVECISTTDGSLSAAGIQVLSLLFNGSPDNLNGQYCYPDLVSITQVLPANILPNDPNCDPALPDAEKQLSTALRAINDMYYNTDADMMATPAGISAESLRNMFHATTSFDICPHIALQIGYFSENLQGQLYAKLGFMELRGHATIICNRDSIYTEKFKKWTPFIAVGFSRNVTNHWGYSFEFAQTLKTKKKLPTITMFNRYRVEQSVTLSRTTFKAMVTYRFNPSYNN